MTDKTDKNSDSIVPKEYLLTFCLVTVLFALWGFANNFTDPMVKVFKDVFAISNLQSSFVQMAFYGGYATMAIPAALFIRKFSYKSGIIVGLILFATGAFISIPAANSINFWLFISGLYILTFGLAFLETTANPFILSMGPEKTSTMRLNLAQAFNPIGSLTGAFIAASVVMTNVHVADFKADLNGFKAELSASEDKKAELSVLPFLKAKQRMRKNDENTKSYVHDKAVSTIEYASAYSSADEQLQAVNKDLSLLGLREATKDAKDNAAKKAAIDKLLDGAGEGKISDQLRATVNELATTNSAYVGLVEAVAELSGEENVDADELKKAKEDAAKLAAAGADYSGLKRAMADLEAGTIESYQGMDLPAVKKKATEVLSLGVSHVSVDEALREFREGKIASYQEMEFQNLQRHDLNLVSSTYMTLGFIVLGTLLVFLIKKMPKAAADDDEDLNMGPTFGRLMKNPRYVFGVISQMFYVGAQIMVWTFIIQYAEKELGMDNATAANHQIAALVIFLTFRFICTAFLRYVSPGKLLAVLALCGIACTLGAIHIEGMMGLYSLMLISACMSLMFPTIYGIALEGIGQDAKLGSAGLILAIVGAVWLTGFQAKILDLETFMGTTATRGSFYLSVGCFIIIALYGLACRNPRRQTPATAK